MKDEGRPSVVTTLLVQISREQEVASAQFTAALFALCEHDHFRHSKPTIEQRIMALRYVADDLEASIGVAP